MRKRKVSRGSNKLYLTHLGAAGWEITDGGRVILLDPYLSRLRVTGQFGTYTTPSLPSSVRAFGRSGQIQDVLWTIYRSAAGLRETFQSFLREDACRPAPA
jgi:hypothetical protein